MTSATTTTPASASTTTTAGLSQDLAGRVAVVTGASRGIGLAIARALAEHGAHVVAGARTPGEELAGLAERHSLTPVPVDLATADGPNELVEHAVQLHERIDILVNNLGGGFTARLGGFLSVTDQDWRHVLDVNLLSAVRACRAALPHLLERRGTILNVSTVLTKTPGVPSLDYAAAKAALLNLTKNLAEEFGPRGVRVNAISPGVVRTPGWVGDGGWADQISAAFGVAREEFIEAMPGRFGMTLGRLVEPGEVADLACYLVSDRARMITGADYTIDGGMLKTI